MSTIPSPSHPLLRLLLAVVCLSALPLHLHALAMGPGMFMVQDVPPGREVDLHKLGGTRFTVYNKSDQDQDFNLTCQQPSKGGVAEWEKGYEEIPDPAWCRLEETIFTVPAHGEKQIGLIITIPDAPENYNRRFMLAVVLRSGRQVGMSIGLAIASRVEIETLVDGRPACGTGGPIGTVPGTITLSGRPGATVSGAVQLRNNTAGRLDAAVERLPQVYADPVKHDRYFSHGFAPQKEPWFAPQSATCILEAGAVLPLSFTGTIPATAAVGATYEELAFIRSRTAEGKEVVALVRLHCRVGPETTPIPETPRKP